MARKLGADDVLGRLKSSSNNVVMVRGASPAYIGDP